jgi:Putative transposase, YhgA-like
MADLPRNLDDALFKLAFSSPTAAASQFRALLPAELLAAVDLDTLRADPTSFVDPVLRQRHSDLLFTGQLRDGSEAFLYVLYEAQSSPDPLMPYRILRYMVRIWDRWLRKREEAKQSVDRLPAIVPVVLFKGAKPWGTSRRMHDLIDLPAGALAAIGHAIPNFEFVLDDLTLPPDAELVARNAPPIATMTLMLFKHDGLTEDLLAVWRSIPEVVGELTKEKDWTYGLGLLALYTVAKGDVSVEELAKLVGELTSPEGERTVMTTAEKLEELGMAKASRRILLRVLRRSFGDALPSEILTRIDEADAATLETWVERALDASTLDDVFGEASA